MCFADALAIFAAECLGFFCAATTINCFMHALATTRCCFRHRLPSQLSVEAIRGDNRSRDLERLPQHLEATGVAGCAREQRFGICRYACDGKDSGLKVQLKAIVVAINVAAAALRSVVFDVLVHSS